MKAHDEKLLILYKYLQNNEYSRDEVAEELEITPRQLTRLIKQWQEDDLIEYSVGVGRGNLSTFKFNVDVEQQFIMSVLSHLDTYSIEEITNILNLPLNESSKNLIKGLFNNAVKIDEDIIPVEMIGKAITVDYIYRFPDDLNPLQPMDTALDALVYNTMDRLYEVDGSLEFKSHLIQHETIEDDSLTIFMFQDITFSNGKQLLAQDIKHCLDRLVNDKWYSNLLSYIEKVEVIDLFVLKITFDGHIDKLKFDLSSPYASIYLKEGADYIGTNVYSVNRVTKDYIVLQARHTTHHNLPEVQKVYLVNSYSNYKQFIEDKYHELLLHDIKMIRFTIFNPYFTDLDYAERKQLLYYIQRFHQGAIDEHIESMPITQKPIVMGMIDLTSHVLVPLFNYLKSVGFNMNKYHISYKDTLRDNTEALPIDFTLIGHSYIPEVYYYSLLNNTNIKTWFNYFDESKAFNRQITHKPIEEWAQAEQQFQSFLIDEAWYAENVKQLRNIIVLKGHKNVVFNNDGVILYGEIIVRE